MFSNETKSDGALLNGKFAAYFTLAAMTSARTVAISHGVGATILAAGLLFVGAAAADAYHLPFIHGWALMHGTIFVMFPVYFTISYFLLRPVARRLGRAPADNQASANRLSVLAIFSFLLSGSGFLIPFVGSILGVATGHFARLRIQRNPELTGSGFALAALILGYLGLAYSLYVFGMVSWVASGHGS